MAAWLAAAAEAAVNIFIIAAAVVLVVSGMTAQSALTGLAFFFGHACVAKRDEQGRPTDKPT